MAALALPVAILLGMLAELVAGLVTWPLGGEKRWWRGVSGIGSDALRLLRDREGDQRSSFPDAGGAAAALLGAGLAAAGALDLGPDGLVFLYLALALGLAGATVVDSGRSGRRSRLAAGLAEIGLAAGLGTLFLRYGALDLEAVRGTQQILGTGLILGPVETLVGLVAAAMAVAWSLALDLPRPEGEAMASAGASILLRLCRWSLIGATSLVGGALLAGGGLDPISNGLSLLAAGTGFAMAVGIADAVLRRLSVPWQTGIAALALGLGLTGATLVVLP